MGSDIDSIIDLIDREESFFSKLKDKLSVFLAYHKSWFLVPILIFVLTASALLANTIEVPYVDYELEINNIPVEEVVQVEIHRPTEVIERVEIVTPVNYTVSQRSKENITVNECSTFDPEYTFDYAGDIKDIGIRDYNYKDGYGYDDGRYQQTVHFCNQDIKSSYIIYKVCHYYDLEEIECRHPDRVELEPESCERIEIYWKTLFDNNKDIKVKILEVSKIEKCYDVEKEIEVGKRSTRLKRSYETNYEYITKVKNISVTENKSVITTREVIEKKEVIKKKPILHILFEKLFN